MRLSVMSVVHYADHNENGFIIRTMSINWTVNPAWRIVV